VPIINQNLDISQQKTRIQSFISTAVNGTTFMVGMVENQMTITDCKVAMNGVSGSPSVMLGVYRFTAASGAMSFIIGSSFVVTSFATSGYMSYSLPTTGSTLLNLQKGDILMCVQGGGTGAASASTIIDVIAKNVQDVTTWY
jgi:hypothetical protein